MEQFFYTETMTVMNADADFRSLLKPSALLRYVEQISTDHARAFGMDDQFFKERGVTFLVGKQALKFDRVDCRWIVASLAEGRILREPGWTVENFWNDTVEDELPLQLHKCKDGLTSAGEWTVRYSQCDLNGHLNNAFYLDLVCDALPLEVMRKGPVTFASINYHREIPMGETAEVFYAPSADGWYVVGKHNGQTSFECYLEVGKTNV